MSFKESEIESFLEKLEPKIRDYLYRTNKENRDDLRQDLIELIIRKLKSNTFHEVPGFFEVLEKETKPEKIK
jgi:hypothetical protein